MATSELGRRAGLATDAIRSAWGPFVDASLMKTPDTELALLAAFHQSKRRE